MPALGIAEAVASSHRSFSGAALVGQAWNSETLGAGGVVETGIDCGAARIGTAVATIDGVPALPALGTAASFVLAKLFDELAAPFSAAAGGVAAISAVDELTSTATSIGAVGLVWSTVCAGLASTPGKGA